MISIRCYYLVSILLDRGLASDHEFSFDVLSCFELNPSTDPCTSRLALSRKTPIRPHGFKLHYSTARGFPKLE